jgi:hypothetical protein
MRESKKGIDRIYDRISFFDNNSERRNYSDLHDELRIEIENLQKLQFSFLYNVYLQQILEFKQNMLLNKLASLFWETNFIDLNNG